MGKYDLILGDTLQRSTLEADTVDLTVTSPPYNVGVEYDPNRNGGCNDQISYDEYLKFSKRWLENVYHWTKPTGRLCLNVGLDKNKQGKKPVCADLTRMAMALGWQYHTTIIWNEGTISRRTAWGSWRSASAPHVIAPVEVIIVLYKDEWKRDRRGTSTIGRDEFIEWTNGMWQFGGAKKNGHPAPFPLELPRRCIQLFSYKEDIIFDPFCGSGTTIVAALDGGRYAKGVEISKEYYKLAKNRIRSNSETYQTRLLPKEN
ncbi:MAG: site-specific DNA-methyltransferase [Cenarchaeum sp. SB0677_bin_16]|nr:site-specific DNA-methyltransferase [Cenarchaeum sp. SB0662_bin_33]MYG33362.1 site-specific DNA-methyltransferase [Cenarchaeum sp. SB0677_bin_16]